MMKTDSFKKAGPAPGPRIKKEGGAPARDLRARKGPAPDDLAEHAGAPQPPWPKARGSIPPRRWFLTFMCMNIPIAGWIYLLLLAFGKKKNQLRDFAKAYLLYKLVFLGLALIILGILVYIGLGMADKLLDYMEML